MSADSSGQVDDSSYCYQTSILTHAGASGGPVISKGLVVGVNSTGIEVPSGEEPISYITPLTELLDLEVHDGDQQKFTVRQLIDEEFFASHKKNKFIFQGDFNFGSS